MRRGAFWIGIAMLAVSCSTEQGTEDASAIDVPDDGEVSMAELGTRYVVSFPGKLGDPPDTIRRLTQDADGLVITYHPTWPEENTICSTKDVALVSEWSRCFAIECVPTVRYVRVASGHAGQGQSYVARRSYGIELGTGSLVEEEEDNCECLGNYAFSFSREGKPTVEFRLVHSANAVLILIKSKWLNHGHDTRLSDESAREVAKRLDRLLEASKERVKN